jgi:hypothetical protein
MGSMSVDPVSLEEPGLLLSGYWREDEHPAEDEHEVPFTGRQHRFVPVDQPDPFVLPDQHVAKVRVSVTHHSRRLSGVKIPAQAVSLIKKSRHAGTRRAPLLLQKANQVVNRASRRGGTGSTQVQRTVEGTRSRCHPIVSVVLIFSTPKSC